MKYGKLLCVLWVFLFALSSCHYTQPDWANELLTKDARDSLKYLYERHYDCCFFHLSFDHQLALNADYLYLRSLYGSYIIGIKKENEGCFQG